jgi:hypothetical protein
MDVRRDTDLSAVTIIDDVVLKSLTTQTVQVDQLQFDDSGGSTEVSGQLNPQAIPPTVTTLPATDVYVFGAQLNAEVNPNGFSTGYFFEYGETASYGSETPRSSVGFGTDAINTSFNIVGLACGTTYHVRVVAENEGGIIYGNDLIFNTDSCDVYPPRDLNIVMAAPDGIMLTWTDTSTNEEAFRIEYLPPGATEFEHRFNQSPNAASWIDPWGPFDIGYQYCYRVKAWASALGDSEPSNVACVARQEEPAPPSPPEPVSIPLFMDDFASGCWDASNQAASIISSGEIFEGVSTLEKYVDYSFRALKLECPAIDIDAATHLSIAIRPTYKRSYYDLTIYVSAHDGSGWYGSDLVLDDYVAGSMEDVDVWYEVLIPLTDLGISDVFGGAKITTDLYSRQTMRIDAVELKEITP